MKDLYKIAYECRNADSTRFWTMFGLMTTLNGALLAFIGQRLGEKSFAALFAVLGAIVCLLWLLMQVRYKCWCDRWDERLREFEPFVLEEIRSHRGTMGLPSLPDTIRLFKEKEQPRLPGLSTRRGPCYMAAVFMIAWLILRIIAVCRK